LILARGPVARRSMSSPFRFPLLIWWIARQNSCGTKCCFSSSCDGKRMAVWIGMGVGNSQFSHINCWVDQFFRQLSLGFLCILCTCTKRCLCW
jgi:hypothetical protein